MDKLLVIIFKIGLILSWLVLGYIFLDLPRMKELEIEYPMIAYQIGDQNFVEEMKIKINGKLTKRIFSGNEFQGKIELYNFETEKMQEYDLWFVKSENANYMGGWIEKPKPHVGTQFQFPDIIGSVFVSQNMKNITIWLSNETPIRMSGPASTREEAIKINNNILNIK